jgi:hypothetical protein
VPGGRLRFLRAATVTAITAACVLASAPACAQETTLSLDVGASYSLPPAGGIGIASTYVNGGLRLAGLFGSGGYFHAGGFGGLALSDGGSSWGSFLAGGGWVQPVSRTLSVGLAATGEAFTVGEPLPYRAAYAQAEPEVWFVSGGTTVRLRAYGGLGVSEVTVLETFVRDTRFGPRVFEVGVPVSSNLWAWGGGAEIGQQLGALAPRLAVEGYDSPQGTYVVGRLGLEVRPRGGVFYLEGSVWDTPDGEELVLVAGLRVDTGGKSSFLASGGRYGPDPLLDSPAAGSLGAGVSLGLARLGSQPDLTWEVLEDGRLTLVLSLRAPAAGTVECAGEFTSWEKVPMLSDGNAWRVTLPIAPGVYHFGFFVDGEWYVPPGAPGLTEDDWGETQATIIVSDPAPIRM